MRTADGAVYGPVDRRELDSWVNEGRVAPQFELQREGESQWRPATAVYPQLAPSSPGAASPGSSGKGFDLFAGGTPSGSSGGSFGGSPVAGSGAGGSYNPFSDSPPPNPYPSPQPQYGSQNPYLAANPYSKPHRGPLILVFGILGWVFCPLGIIFAPLAWALGHGDLREMRQGRMDPSGMGMTQAGMILGIILTIFNLLCCGFYGVMFVIGVANGEIR